MWQFCVRLCYLRCYLLFCGQHNHMRERGSGQHMREEEGNTCGRRRQHMRGAGNACGWSAESVLTPSLISYGNQRKSGVSSLLPVTC